MRLTLKFFATHRETVGQKTIEREYDDDATVGDVLAALEAEFEGFEGEFLADGAVREHVRVLKNGSNVVHQEGIDTDLSEGDTLSLFPPVAGGTWR